MNARRCRCLLRISHALATARAIGLPHGLHGCREGIPDARSGDSGWSGDADGREGRLPALRSTPFGSLPADPTSSRDCDGRHRQSSPERRVIAARASEAKYRKVPGAPRIRKRVLLQIRCRRQNRDPGSRADLRSARTLTALSHVVQHFRNCDPQQRHPPMTESDHQIPDFPSGNRPP